MDMDKFINDQLSVWPAACGNFRALRKVVTKRAVVGGLEIVVQHNPARIVSSAAKTDTESLKRRKCFLCRENRPPEQSAIDFEGRKGRKYDILLNPYPIFRNHLVIAMKEHTPQSIWRRYVDMLDLAVALPGYTVFYNGPECGASAPDHHHFQAASRGQMPLESAVDAFFDSCMQPGCSLQQEGAAAPAFQSIASNMDAELFLYGKYLPGVFAIRGTTSKSVAKLFYRLLDCAAAGTGRQECAADGSLAAPEPKCNVFVWSRAGEFRSVVVFRSSHRSHHYYSDGPDHLTMSPGAADMAGCVVAPVAEEFEKLDSSLAESLLTEVALDRDTEKRIVDRLTRRQDEVEVGIMSAPEIVFEVLTDGAGPRRAAYRDGKIEYDGSLYDELFFEAKTLSTMFAEPSFRLCGVTIGVGFHWERAEDQLFAGALKIIVDGDRLTAVNVVGIEDYLVSVISSEMKSTAPIEFLKAHAVISRSWVMRMKMHENAGKEGAGAMNTRVSQEGDAVEITRWYGNGDHAGFDVCADDHCQRYQGLTRASEPAVRRAVDETWGQVLMYDGKICDTRFSKCCGGLSEKFSACWEDVDYGYLQGGRECVCGKADPELLENVLNSYDLETEDWYRWQAEYGRDELSALFSGRSGVDAGTIRALVPMERGASGRIVKLKVIGSRKTVTVGKELEIRRVLSETHLKSSAFDVEYPDACGDRIRLRGSGWGHGVGLCQIGAAVMASEGSGYKTILAHYYPGSQLMPRLAPQDFTDVR